MALTGAIRVYNLDEASGTTATDATGGSNGTYAGSGVTYEIGTHNTPGVGVTFDGSNGNLSMPLAYNSDWSLNFWFCPRAYGTNGSIVANDGGGTNRALLLQGISAAYTFALGVWNSSDSATVSVNPLASTATLNEWIMITLVKSSTQFIMYRNATAISTTSSAFTYKNANSGVTYLADRNTPALKFNGSYSQCVYWQSALDGGDVTNLYNGGIGLKYPFTDVVKDSQPSVAAGANVPLRYNSSYERTSYEFTPGSSYSLKEADLALKRIGTPSGTVTCDIYAANGSGLPTGSSLGTSSAVTVDKISTDADGSFKRFVWSSAVSLTSGSRYCFVLSGTFSLSTTNNIRDVSASIGGKVAGAYNGSSWSVDSTGAQIGFATYEGVTSTVPVDTGFFGPGI